ncbi:MAG TPA: DHA2 family efflux MFS transporter permease subunit [Pseudonocardia sp.]
MSDRRSAGWALPLLVLVLGTFLASLGTSIINVAISAIQRDFGGGIDAVRWVSTAYLLTLGITTTTSSWLSERFGATRVFLACLIMFTIASTLCGLAWDLNSLIAFRVLQAAPGGVIPVVAMTLLFRLVPPDRVGGAMGLFGMGVILAPALGPAVGGWLVEYATWPLVFFVMVPVGVLGIIAALVIFPKGAETTRPRFDTAGFVTIAAGLVALTVATDRGPDWGWTSYGVLMLATVSLLCIALFVVIEFEVDQPLIDPRVMRTWVYSNALVLISISAIGLFALLYYVPQYLQTNKGYSSLDAGLLLMPSALAMAFLAPIAGRMLDRFGPRWPVTIGLAVAAYGSILLAGITPDVPRDKLILWTTVRNVGVGLSMMPIMASGVAALPPSLINAGSTLANVVMRTASSLGVAVFGGLQTAQHAQLMADRGALLAAGSGHAAPGATGNSASVLAPMYQKLAQTVGTTTYANAFYLVAVMTAVGVVLALMLRSGPNRPAESRPAVPAGASPGAVARDPVDVEPAGPPAPRLRDMRPAGAREPVPDRRPADQEIELSPSAPRL